MELDKTKKELIASSVKFDECISHRLITLEEVKEFLNKDIYEVFSYNYIELKDYKTRMLYNLYLKPYIMYYSKYFENCLLGDIAEFVENRYLQERRYLDDKFYNGEIHRLDYQNQINKLELYYIYSSKYGTSILRKHVR